MRLVRVSCALLLGLLAHGALSRARTAGSGQALAMVSALPWPGRCFFDRGSAVLKPDCKRQLEEMASCWFHPQPPPYMTAEMVRRSLLSSRLTLQPLMSEEEFAELRSDQLAWARGEAGLTFLLQLGVPRDVAVIQVLYGGKRAWQGYSPQDPIQRQMDLLGPWEVLCGPDPGAVRRLEPPPFAGPRPRS